MTYLRSVLRTVLMVTLFAGLALSVTAPASAAPAKGQTVTAKSAAVTAAVKRKKLALQAKRKKIAQAEAKAAAKSKRLAKLRKARKTQVASKKKRTKTQVASSGKRSGGISWNASGGCLPGVVKAALVKVAAAYGSITVNSTYRSPGHNRRVGGAGRSMHLQCRAADFRVNGGGGNVIGFLQKLPGLGGIKRYRSGFYHIDDGERRTWKG